jgi:Na+-translocating ferredoxin:NAD+ oxidoreductase subunit B
MSDVYKSLARHLDRLPGGFPATDTGVELRILERLFTPEEAHIALGLELRPEPAEAIAIRLGIPAAQLEPRLMTMSHKGLIFRQTKSGKTTFMAAQFVVGIWEYHLNDLDPQLIRDVNEYMPLLADQWAHLKTKPLRVIPVSRSLSADTRIMPYEQAERIIAQQSKIVVAPCICRKEHRIMGHGCDYPLEACLCFGSGAYYYEENGLGRAISQEEALHILEQGINAGLVLQPGNAKKTANICMCCGCCCQVLKNIKALPKPAEAVNSSYYAVVEAEACIACGACEARCHMDAVTVEDTARIDLGRCIGCGACVSACEVAALKLIAKPAEERWVPPDTLFHTYLNIAKERGLL